MAKNTLKIYLFHIKLSLRSLWVYKNALLGDLVANISIVGTSLIGITAIFSSFKTLNSWTLNESLFLLSMNMFCNSIASTLVADGMAGMSQMLIRGEYDILLLRPMNPLLFVACRSFNYRYLIQGVLAIFIFIYSCNSIQLYWSPMSLIAFVLFLTSGIFLNMGIYIISGATNFWFLNFNLLGELISNESFGIRSLANYPIQIYQSWIQFVLTFVIPFAAVGFFPSVWLIPKSDSSSSPDFFPFITIAISVIFFILAAKIWLTGIKKYNSVGS